MALIEDYANAATRYLEAADHLSLLQADSNRVAVAGYLYGLAAECAVKKLMQVCGIQPLPFVQGRPDRSDPYFMHIPGLLTTLRDTASGRMSQPLLKCVQNNELLKGWSTHLRYENAQGVVNPRNKQGAIFYPVRTWAAQATHLVQTMKETP